MNNTFSYVQDIHGTCEHASQQYKKNTQATVCVNTLPKINSSKAVNELKSTYPNKKAVVIGYFFSDVNLTMVLMKKSYFQVQYLLIKTSLFG